MHQGMPLERQHMQQLVDLYNVIHDHDVKNHITHLHASGIQILNFVDANPDQAHKANMFKEYYLPKTVNLLDKYASFNQQAIRGQNIQDAMDKIAGTLPQFRRIFDHSLNSLYSDIVQDVSMDIEVLEQMMDLDGLE